MRSQVSVLISDSSGFGLGRMVLVSEGLVSILVSVSDGQVSVSDFEAETPSLILKPVPVSQMPSLLLSSGPVVGVVFPS